MRFSSHHTWKDIISEMLNGTLNLTSKVQKLTTGV